MKIFIVKLIMLTFSVSTFIFIITSKNGMNPFLNKCQQEKRVIDDLEFNGKISSKKDFKKRDKGKMVILENGTEIEIFFYNNMEEYYNLLKVNNHITKSKGNNSITVKGNDSLFNFRIDYGCLNE